MKADVTLFNNKKNSRILFYSFYVFLKACSLLDICCIGVTDTFNCNHLDVKIMCKYVETVNKLLSIVASPLGLGCGCASWVSYCGLGGFLFRWLTRARVAAFFIRAHSQRKKWAFPRPTGSLTARVLVNGGSALPRVSTCLLLFSSSVSRHLGTARLVLHRLASAEPRALTATRNLGHSPVFPHFRRKACLSR